LGADCVFASSSGGGQLEIWFAHGDEGRMDSLVMEMRKSVIVQRLSMHTKIMTSLPLRVVPIIPLHTPTPPKLFTVGAGK